MARQATIKITVKGVEVTNPVVVTFRVDANAAKDIRASDFDPDTPIAFTIDAILVQELTAGEGKNQAARPRTEVVPGFDDEFNVELLPGLIHKRSSSTFRFITDGEPTGVTHTSGDLADVEIRPATSFGEVDLERRARVRKVILFGIIAFTVALGILAIVVSLEINALN